MFNTLLSKIFGTKTERDIKKLQPFVAAVNEFEPEIKNLSDQQLREKTNEFKNKISNGAAAKRKVHMRPFDVQIIGGVVLHQGKIAEMKTGEGKTLVATLPAYLNALEKNGSVHIVTVNDYLAKRDAEWMGPIYKTLGLEVGIIQHDMNEIDRQDAYEKDITYGTNNEFGFDYLRDNMKFRLMDIVQKEHKFAILDEVDSILIDEARTPLIISGPTEDSTSIYYKINNLVKKLDKSRDYQIDEKTRTAVLTEDGVEHAEKSLHIDNLYDIKHMDLIHAINQALKAHHLFKKDVDYMIKDGKVIIVDEFTGRLMPGRRYSDGLHQALEAKENVRIEAEYQTLASITFQNYFRMYEKLAGMTGTATTEAAEFHSLYDLDVVEIPTNKPLIRNELDDLIYRTAKEKWDAVANEIIENNKKGRPVLVGTISIEKSEYLSSILNKQHIKHNVLNAKYHESEAKIIAQAGRVGAVTIATNMAGRGVDILLGGNPDSLAEDILNRKGDKENSEEEERQKALQKALSITMPEKEKVISLGGLHVIGTERHEARRIDNQLRGRCGRQGDPGSSRFYLSLEDDLMRIFGSEKISGIMTRVGMEEGVPIEHKMVTKAIERAQKQVEARNFSIRKHLLEYDDVMNKQRESIYSQRKEILQGKNMKEYLQEIRLNIVDWIMDTNTNEDKSPDDWNIEGFTSAIKAQFGLDVDELEINWETINFQELHEKTINALNEIYEEKERMISPERMREFERIIMLQVIDSQWKDHLLAMDHLKEGIGLRGYGQRDPLVEYKRESYDMFQAMMDRVEEETLKFLFLLQPVEKEEMPERKEQEIYYKKPQTFPTRQGKKARSVIPKKRKKGKRKKIK